MIQRIFLQIDIEILVQHLADRSGTGNAGTAVHKQEFPGIEGLHERCDPLGHGFVEESEGAFRIRRGVVELQTEDILPVDRDGAAGILRKRVADRNEIVLLPERRIRPPVDGERIVSPPVPAEPDFGNDADFHDSRSCFSDFVRGTSFPTRRRNSSSGVLPATRRSANRSEVNPASTLWAMNARSRS